MSPTVIGLVGGIASGKSTVADLFAAECGAVHVDADAIARRLLGRPQVKKAIARLFPGVVDGNGNMDRARLAARVFDDAGALQRLEEITHPPIRRALEAALRRAGDAIVILDAPLLFEAGLEGWCDLIVHVACPARTRRARARRDRGWSEAEHRRREARQWSCRRKRARADEVVDNGGDAAKARRDVRRIVRRLERRG